MYKSLILSVLLIASIEAAEAATQEATNSGTSSYLAEQVRTNVAARSQEGRYQPKTTLPVNWAQDHWR